MIAAREEATRAPGAGAGPEIGGNPIAISPARAPAKAWLREGLRAVGPRKAGIRIVARRGGPD